MSEPPPAYLTMPTEDHKASAPPMHQQFPPQPGSGYDPSLTSGGYPPQPGYPPSYPVGPGGPTHTTVVIAQTTLGQQSTMSPRPVAITCPQCQAQIITETSYNPGLMTWLMAGGLCFGGLFCGLCCVGLIPLCVNDCQDVEHRCPNCKSFIGQFKRL